MKLGRLEITWGRRSLDAVARPRACDCAQNITDADLPPIRRVWGNMWKEKWSEGYMELVKANKGLRRLNYRCEKLRAEVRWLKNELERYRPKGPSEKAHLPAPAETVERNQKEQ